MTGHILRKTLLIVALAAGAMALGACQSVGDHDAFKFQGAGITFSPTSGVHAGYVGGTYDHVQNVDKDGKAILTNRTGGCGPSVPDTFANMNSKANASAQSTGLSNAPGVTSPQIAWASGDETANGYPAIIAEAARTPHPDATIAAICGERGQPLPSAPQGSIVQDGVAPK